MIYDVRIVSGNVSIFIQYATFACTLVTVILLIFRTVKQHRLERESLIVTPRDIAANHLTETLFISLSFSNESALPISVLDINLSLSRRQLIANSKHHDGGTAYACPIPVTKLSRSGLECIDYGFSSTVLPVTLSPLSSFSGYFAFYAGKQDADILCNKAILIEIRTSRDTFRFEADFGIRNYYEYSYRNDGVSIWKEQPISQRRPRIHK